MVKKSYTELQQELGEITTQMQDPELDIEKAMDLYKKGKQCTVQLGALLQKAKLEIDEIGV